MVDAPSGAPAAVPGPSSSLPGPSPTLISKLQGVHPQLIAALQKVLCAMADLGYPMIVTAGVRTLAEQQALYAQGRTAPGDIVTNADGVRTPSNHQVHPDGLGHAVDCAFLVHGEPSWAASLPWATYGACGQALGLTWGGDWHSLKDLPHLELPGGIPNTGAGHATV